MEEYAEHEFRLNLPASKSDKATEREHLEIVERQTGQTPKELEGPDPPPLMENVWSAFVDLNMSRQSGMGPNPITFQEIVAWSKLYNTPLRPWEVTAIKRLDMIFIKVNTDG